MIDSLRHLHHAPRPLSLDDEITRCRKKLRCHHPGHPNRVNSLYELVFVLYKRFEERGDMNNLEEVVTLCRKELLSLGVEGQPSWFFSVDLLAKSLHSRFQRLGTLSDLDEALSLRRKVLEFHPQGLFLRVSSLGNLAIVLHSRFQQLGTLSDLDEALALQRSALEIYPQGHPDRAFLLVSIAHYLQSRFQQIGTLSDLEEALALRYDVLKLYPQGHPLRASSMSNLANSLFFRFQQLRILSDLNEALSLQRSVLELHPQGHPLRSFSLSNLANSLYSRFQQLGAFSDLEEAIVLQRSALELRPQGHPHRALSLNNLANSLHSRFQQFGTSSDLEEALALQRSVLELCPQGHPNRAFPLSNVSNFLCSRFAQLGILSDLNEAVTLQRQVLALHPQGHPLQALSLSNLANSLYSRFQQHETLSDLEEALVLERSALELRPPSHPHRASSLGNLAKYLHARPKRSATREISGLQEMFNLYSQLPDLPHTVSLSGLDCAKQWIRAAEEHKHSTTVLAYQTFLRLCVHHFATLPSLPQHLTLLKQLTGSTSVDAFSACILDRNYANAVELLEQGRAVFWSQLFRLRSPLGDVIASGDTGKMLAEKYAQTASLLRGVLDGSPDAESRHDRAWRLNTQLQDTAGEIRRLPGFSRFLQPPLFADLRIAASDGPVIILNASQYGCDALVVLLDRDPIRVPLPITKPRVSELSVEIRSLTSRAKFGDVTRDILVLLRELWDVVVYPIVKILQEFLPRRSRIWWCPTADFSLLPLHASGSFRKGQPTLSNLYISSYTPTLTALIRARQKRPMDPSIERHRFLLVGQAQAPGQCKLASVNVELSSISQRIGPIATLTRVQDEDATIVQVAEELGKNEFVHLACHGIPNQKRPFESGFALGDGLLKVERIMQYDLRHAQFAYLSACHTTVGDEESPDEAIHLAAAMQFAGFRSVIGTMWAVDDAFTNEITSRFYDRMKDDCGRLDHTRAALALHETMNSFHFGEIPFDQRILYIHIGA